MSTRLFACLPNAPLPAGLIEATTRELRADVHPAAELTALVDDAADTLKVTISIDGRIDRGAHRRACIILDCFCDAAQSKAA